jgi:hypothetical protein
MSSVPAGLVDRRGWTTLLMVQAWLFNAKNVALHRSLDSFGIARGAGALFTGMLG